MAHPYSADLESALHEHQVPFESACERHCVDRAETSAATPSIVGSRTAGGGSTNASAPQSRRASSCSCPSSTTTRRCIGRSARREAHTLAPPKPGERRPLPPLEELLESGHVLALNFPGGPEPRPRARARRDAQAGLPARRAPADSQDCRTSGADWRDLLFVCDEYHAFATVGETDPTGDERTFALSRQARLIPIVATQSVSSLRSALPGDESWRTLLQCFRTKLFLATSDEFTAKAAADLCGRRDRLKAHYTLSEGGQGAHVSLLTGRATATKQSVSASKSYAPHHEYIFPPRVFTELAERSGHGDSRTTGSTRCRRSSAT